MRFIKLFGREMCADDWILWGIGWASAGFLFGSMAVLCGLAWGWL